MPENSTGIGSSGGAGSDSNSGNFYQGDGGSQGRRKRKKSSPEQRKVKESNEKRQILERQIMGVGIWTDLYRSITNQQTKEDKKKQVVSYRSSSLKKRSVHINA